MSKTLKYISKISILLIAGAVVYVVGNVTRLLSGTEHGQALLPNTASADLITSVPGPSCSTCASSAGGCGGCGGDGGQY